jgi:Zn-dependent metalloprotease
MPNRWILVALVAFLASCTSSGELAPRSSDPIFTGDPAVASELAARLAGDWLVGDGAPAVADVDQLAVRLVEVDGLGMAHVRLDQTQGGVPVFGGQAILHFRANGDFDSMTDGLVHALRNPQTAAIGQDDGVQVALQNHAGVVDTVAADLQVIRHDGVDHLAWRVSIDSLDTDHPSRPVIFVDARSGQPIWRYDNLQTSLNRRTYDGRNRNSLPGRIARTEGQGPIGDGPIDDAHDHAGITWDYYFQQEGRDSYDGAGATLTSTAHHQRNYDNAFWNGSQMVYGDGDVYFYPLSGALDVVGHELTHAVTEHSANLIYAGESGGLNEATSDILGVAIEAYAQGWTIDGDTWLLGEDIARPALGPALRFMDDPTADGVSIDNYADYTNGIDVHHSSGIANKAFYLMATGGILDLESAAHLWYRALTLYMTPSTTFAEARDATVSAATDLHGAGSAQVAAVESAWAAVGVQPPLAYTVIDTQSGLSASTGGTVTASYATGANSQGIRFSIAGGSGDADLYVRFGAAPTTSAYDCRPYLTGNTESCTFEPSQTGTYHVMIQAYQAFSGLTLTVSEAGGEPPPPVEICDDGIDNDEDGATDCDDSDCAFDLACAEPEVCDDGVDNDLDGATDCDDSDCALELVCAVPEVCDDGVDNDLDGAADCDDADCMYFPACVPDEVCDDGVDNDYDGATDCADSDCALDLACAEPEDCADGIDNDLDGATDCADTDCDAAPECATSCPGGELTGTLSSSNRDEYFTDAAPRSGFFGADLSGPASANYDLYLEYLNGNRWRTRASSTDVGADESIAYDENSNVLHRWHVRRRSGSGDFTLCVQ